MTLLTGEAFDRIFAAFSATADRVELRDCYRSEVEDEVIRRFVAGEPDDMAWSQAWFDKIRALSAEGKRFRRVRVVTVPLTDYQRCGVVRVTPHSIEAGEDIRYLDRSEITDLGLPSFDYWLFDAGLPTSRAVRLIFDEHDGFVGADVIVGDALVELGDAFTRAFERAQTPEHFAEVHGLR